MFIKHQILVRLLNIGAHVTMKMFYLIIIYLILNTICVQEDKDDWVRAKSSSGYFIS